MTVLSGYCGIRVCCACRDSDRVRLSPKFASHANRVDASRGPPAGFVASAVQLAMMSTAERYSEFVAYLEAETSSLRKAANASAIRRALENAGIELIEENGGGPGGTGGSPEAAPSTTVAFSADF